MVISGLIALYDKLTSDFSLVELNEDVSLSLIHT